MAALLSLTQHVRNPYQLSKWHDGLSDRVTKGRDFVAHSLKQLQRRPSYRIGFEVLVPGLLDLLQNEGLTFVFPAKHELLQSKQAKLSKVPPEELQKSPSTLLYSLEALYGDSGFPIHSLQKRSASGSMMGSPSATAAYLMRCNSWDDSAEAYLRLALSNGPGQSSGCVPAVFPTTYFELIWVCKEPQFHVTVPLTACIL